MACCHGSCVYSSWRKQIKKEEAILITIKGNHGHSLTPLGDGRDRGWGKSPINDPTTYCIG